MHLLPLLCVCADGYFVRMPLGEAEAVYTLHVPLEVGCGNARRFASHIATAIGRDDLADDASLLVGELVGNSLRHAHTPATVVACPCGEGVRFDVVDGSTRTPRLRDVTASAESGRGLRLVDALSDEWGVEVNGTGKSVWFRMESPERPNLPAMPVTPFDLSLLGLTG